MIEQAKIISELWPLLAALIGLIVWLVRLEGRVNQSDRNISNTDKRVDVLTTQHDTMDKDLRLLGTDLSRDISSVKVSLARIEGALGLKQD